jgi:hypothetical protein
MTEIERLRKRLSLGRGTMRIAVLRENLAMIIPGNSAPLKRTTGFTRLEPIAAEAAPTGAPSNKLKR